MNFQYLAQKYISGAHFVMHDRTYEGLEWFGPGDKPGIDFFKQAQAAEDASKRAEMVPVEAQDELMQERQEQARAEAEKALVSFEERVKLETLSMKSKIQSLGLSAILARQSMELKAEMLQSWHELTKAQEMINEEARAYLDSTDYYVTRKTETGADIPEAILQARELARSRVAEGIEVYARWQELRKNEMPSREEIAASIKAGGSELERIKKTIDKIKGKYRKPSRE